MKRYRVIVFLWLLVAIPVFAQQPAAQPKDYTAHVTGYAHIDMAWLWRWEESVYDIMFNTFSNQRKLDSNFLLLDADG